MRVVVMSDQIGPLSSARAGALLAAGWPRAATTVIPAGEAGRGFAQSVADGWGVEMVPEVVDDVLLSWSQSGDTVVLALATAKEPPVPSIPRQGSSIRLGVAVRRVLAQAARPVAHLWLDCASVATHDGGAGFLSGLGATADRPLDRGVDGLAGIGEVVLDPVRDLLAGVEVVGVVPAGQVNQGLLGLRGITSLRGRASGAPPIDPGQLLEIDETLERFAGLLAPAYGRRPGAGACGGVGLAVLGVGGRLTTGPALALERAAPSLRHLDLVVTGCSVLDFASRGGGVVAEAARTAEQALCPCIAVAGEVLIGAREMRTMGIESAYPVRESVPGQRCGEVREAELSAVAARVARSWQW
ncbi:MAG TPA: glycerate kinase [Propionibacteriaceae bacterium]|nr:glycerate kinase [Propionibacteriaceae bacterium]